MTPQQLRAFCLSFNAAVEDFPFNPETSVFKVLGKLFALTNLDGRPLTVNLKCDPDDALRLREQHPGLIVPGYHMNKRHWNTVTVEGGGGRRRPRRGGPRRAGQDCGGGGGGAGPRGARAPPPPP
ncbi:MmcQ/YjbR family DNA-binding protein, partial [Streptomyces sp. NPDC059371]|uniref:MmcQ/YjbR family DNA-binding protein n=1 Tax=Streptomyces sp. NPDC059371 TaxID=3346812 RepID=UPI0036A5C205